MDTRDDEVDLTAQFRIWRGQFPGLPAPWGPRGDPADAPDARPDEPAPPPEPPATPRPAPNRD